MRHSEMVLLLIELIEAYHEHPSHEQFMKIGDLKDKLFKVAAKMDSNLA